MSWALEQSLAETRQQAQQVQKIRELMRTFSAHKAKVSDRLDQIDAKLERFEFEFYAPRSADCAHQEFEDEWIEGGFEQDKIETWLATATRAKRGGQGSSIEKSRKALGSASSRNDDWTSAQLNTRPAKMMNARHDVWRHDALEAGSAPSASATSASMTVQKCPSAPDPRAERKVWREWRSHGALPSVAEEHKPSMLPPDVSRSSHSLPVSASSGTLTRAKDVRDHQKSTKPDLGDGRRFDSKEAGRSPPAAPPNTPLYS